MTRPSENPALKAALAYAARGWRVLRLHAPVRGGGCSCGDYECIERNSVGKHPDVGKAWQKKATADPKVLRRWWADRPNRNVGILTGEASGLVVVDLDGDDGMQAFEELAQKHGCPECPIVQTGSGGRHLYFRPNGTSIGNSASKLAPHIDIKEHNGQVVAPPSVHMSGGRYTWIVSPDDIPPPPLPEWITDQLAKVDEQKRGHAPPAANRSQSDQAPGRDGDRYGAAALDGECRAVSDAPEGIRNETLNKAAFCLGQLVGGGVLADSDVRDRLLEAAEACGLSQGEASKTIDSGLSKGQKSPRGPARPTPTGPKDQSARAGRGGTPNPLDTYPGFLSDIGNARRLARQYATDVRYCEDHDSWYCWDGMRWRRGHTAPLDRAIEQLASALRRETGQEYAAIATSHPDDKKAQERRAKRFDQHADRTAKKAGKAGIMDFGRNQPGIRIEPIDLDTHPMLLNCRNGTIDLETGEFREHRRGDYLTKVALVAYDPAAQCPQWLEFLDTIFAGRQDLIQFVQECVGYSCTALVGAHKLLFLSGKGANGKTQLLEAVRAVLGPDYARTIEPRVLLASRGGVDRHSTEIAVLDGCRFACTTEPQSGRRIDVARLKLLTGGDTFSARPVYENSRDIEPTHKLWLAANHRPGIDEQTHAVWRRILLIPFDVEIAEKDQVEDYGKILAAREGPGILAWAVQGCVRRMMRGRFEIPEQVVTSTKKYRQEQDTVQRFVHEMCEADSASTAKNLDLFEGYKKFCKDDRVPALPRGKFGERMTEIGYPLEKCGGAWVRIGLKYCGQQALDLEKKDGEQ